MTTHSGWLPAPQLSRPRTRHRSLVLKNGNVMVVGGVGTNGLPILECEQFDSKRSEWCPAGSLNTAGEVHATVLNDGRVLALVNPKRGGPISEIFDPKIGSWSLTESQPNSHARFLIPLWDGRVLSYSFCTASALFNPKDNSWMNKPFGEEATCGVCIGNGRLFIVCGPSWSGDDIAAPHILEIENGHFQTVEHPDISNHGEILRIADDRLFYFDTEFRGSYTFDLNAETWARFPLPEANSQRFRVLESRGPSLTVLASGNILVSGGDLTDPALDKGYKPLSDPNWDLSRMRQVAPDDTDRFVSSICWIFDCSHDVWRTAPSLIIPRRHHGSALLHDGRVLITGGETGLGPEQATAACEIGEPSLERGIA